MEQKQLQIRMDIYSRKMKDHIQTFVFSEIKARIIYMENIEQELACFFDSSYERKAIIKQVDKFLENEQTNKYIPVINMYTRAIDKAVEDMFISGTVSTATKRVTDDTFNFLFELHSRRSAQLGLLNQAKTIKGLMDTIAKTIIEIDPNTSKKTIGILKSSAKKSYLVYNESVDTKGINYLIEEIEKQMIHMFPIKKEKYLNSYQLLFKKNRRKRP